MQKVSWIAGLLLAGTVFAMAHSGGDNGQIYACVNNGTVKIVPAGTTCPHGQTLITWNVVGPQGPRGLEGPEGPRGHKGSTGPAGPIGPTGPVGPAGAVGPTGPQGVAGPTGPTGDPGADGAVGPTGPAGPAGPAASAYSILGDQATLEPGEPPAQLTAYCHSGDIVMGGGFWNWNAGPGGDRNGVRLTESSATGLWQYPSPDPGDNLPVGGWKVRVHNEGGLHLILSASVQCLHLES